MSDANRIEAAAARWVARRDARELSPEEAVAFEQWCAEDKRHLGALVRLEAVNAKFDRAAALQGLPSAPVSRRRVWVPTAIAASLALGMVGAWQSGVLSPDAVVPAQTFTTRLGEQYRTSLADGSLIELNTATHVAVDLEPRERRIKLDHGEALFEVAKDASRPFVVETSLGNVRAVGTVFSVRVDRGLEVVVSEGVIVVERPGEPLVRVSAGESYAVGVRGDALRSPRDPEQIKRALVWREGKVAFAGQTLTEAAAEFNRYNDVRIEISDPAVGAMRFGGYYRATDPEGFAAALEKSLPITSKREGAVITLSAR